MADPSPLLHTQLLSETQREEEEGEEEPKPNMMTVRTIERIDWKGTIA
jgi:hypothetical protein